MRFSFFLMVIGILIMMGGASTTMALSTIEFGGAKVTDVPTFSATLIFVGIVIFVSGIALYIKGK